MWRKVARVKLSKEPFLNSFSYLLEISENQHSVLFVSFVFVDFVKMHLSMVKFKVLKNHLIFIRPESDHCNWEYLSLTQSCLVTLIDVTLGCEDANSKLVDVVTVAEVDDEQCIANILVEILTLKIVQDIEVEVWSRSRS